MLARLQAWNQPIHRVRARIEKIFETWKRGYGLSRMRWLCLAKASVQNHLAAIACNFRRSANILSGVVVCRSVRNDAAKARLLWSKHAYDLTATPRTTGLTTRAQVSQAQFLLARIHQNADTSTARKLEWLCHDRPPEFDWIAAHHRPRRPGPLPRHLSTGNINDNLLGRNFALKVFPRNNAAQKHCIDAAMIGTIMASFHEIT